MSARPASFGDLLRQHRRAAQLTQEELAERAGISARAISDLERGERTHPYRETAELLTNALRLEGQDRQVLLGAARRSGTVDNRRQGPPEPTAFRLPRPRTPLIGRRAELATLDRHLRTARHLLVTITGPAGVGKTRLLLETATHLREAFPDGVVLVDLAPLTDQTQVVRAIADAVGIVDQGAIPLEDALRRWLSRLHLLLLLDNFEHLLPIAPLVSDLLHAAPALQVLVTSRAALRLEGEQELRLAPLPLPTSSSVITAAMALQGEAVQLFAARAATALPGFQVTDDNAADVVAICQRLDGLPLAIELAAARLALLSPATLLVRLDQRLALLTVNRRDAPERQQTLETAIAWSYSLLTGAEQALLRAMAVFADGWTLEAAESMGRALGLAHPLAAVAALVEHNLVVREDGGIGPRYRMLETIHAFAWDRLSSTEDEASIRQAQLQCFIQFAQACAIERLDAQVEARRSALMAESVNLREAITWALDHDPDAALALLAHLGDFWYVADQQVTGRELLARALSTTSPEDSWARGRVLRSAAWLACVTADYSTAATYAQSSLAVATACGDLQIAARTVIIEGFNAVADGDVSTARALHETALAQCEALGDTWGELLCVTNMGIAEQDWGNLPTAITYFQRIRAMADRLELPGTYHAHALLNLADAYRVQGNLEEALAAAREAVTLSERAVNRMMVTGPQWILAKVLLAQGQVLAAVPGVRQFLTYVWDMGDRWSLTPALETAAIALRFVEQWERAAYLFGAADALRTGLPFPLGVAEREPFQRHITIVHAALGPVAFQAAWESGATARLELVVAQAQAALASLPNELTA